MGGEKSNQGSGFFSLLIRVSSRNIPMLHTKPTGTTKAHDIVTLYLAVCPPTITTTIFSYLPATWGNTGTALSILGLTPSPGRPPLIPSVHILMYKDIRHGEEEGGREVEKGERQRDRGMRHIRYRTCSTINHHVFYHYKEGQPPHLQMIRSSPTERITLRYYWGISVCKLKSPIRLAKLNY